ncbi:MAG: glycosyltransferase family 39 protein [Candidatus Liptonbacteria bacterium]|nr:glycosyltransferase family 39 protein [Candidatus Liptonbacteria bacterium]
MRRHIPSFLCAGIMLIAALLLTWGAYTDSPVMDELAHIPAGYAYVSALDYRLNPEHPPLVKALAGFPLLALNPAFPESLAAWQSDINGQWNFGTAFLYESGNDADLLARVARAGPVIVTLLAILFLYMWARETLGNMWGLLPAVFFALSPIVLAHGHYVTTDVGAAFGIIIATYAFLRFLRAPSKHNLFIAGVALGVAEIAKFSAVLLIPYFLILAVLKTLLTSPPTAKEYIGEARRWMGRTLLVVFTAYAFIVYPVYALFTLGYPPKRQHADIAATLASFEGGPTPSGAICKPLRCIADLTIAATKNPLTRPLAEYSLGVLMVVQRAGGGNTNYFLGKVSGVGSPSYFPMVYGMKETIPALLFLLGACIIGCATFIRSMPRRIRAIPGTIEKNFDAWALGIFIALYWTWSMKSNLNIGVRHIIPALPFMYLLAAHAWKAQLTRALALTRAHTASFPRAASATIQWTCAILLGFWLLTEVALAAPHFLSYFNELGGGTRNGYRYVTDSNYDWGQDLLRLKKWVEQRNNDNNHDNDVEKIAVDYFGGGSPRYYLGGKGVEWKSEKGNPVAQGIRWLAISVNTFQNAIQPTAKGFGRKPEDEYRWLTALRPPAPGMGNLPVPDFRVGTSLFIYKLSR